MRVVVIIFILTVLLAKVHAQISISGQVKDAKTNEASTDAVVHITDHNLFAVSDKEGNYTIKNIKAGTWLFEVSEVGYKTLFQKITIHKDTVINFSLSQSVTELSEVVVTGVSRSTEIRETPVVIKTIDKNYFAQNTSSNLIDALANVPGISNVSTGPAIAKPVIRGLGYNRVITLNNGVRQEGQQWGDEHGIEMDEYAIDRVEIIKGPGSLMYGSDGIAGVLNFIAPQSPAEGKTRTQWISNYQTNNNLIANSISAAGNKNGFQWLGRFTQKIAANYQNKYDGRVANSGFRELDGNLFLGLTKKWGYTYLRLNSWNNTLNLPEGERDSSGRFTILDDNGNEKTATDAELRGYKIGYPHQQINHTSVMLNNYFILSKGTLSIDLGFQNNKRREFSDPTKPDSPELYFDLYTLNYNIGYHLNSSKGWETSAGVSGMLQENKNKGEKFLIPEYTVFDAGVFVTTQKSINDKLVFAGGFRLDNRSLSANSLFLDLSGAPTSEANPFATKKFSAFNQNYNGFSGSLGLSYLINKSNTLKFNISRGFRSPNIAEVASNGRHEGTFRYEIGTPNLKAENSSQLDVAYFHNSDHFTVEISPYINYISNYIFTERLKTLAGTDSIPDPSDPAPAFKFQQGNALLYGNEIFTDLHPHPLDWLHIENAFSFVRGIQLNQPDSTKNLPFIPAPRYKGELRAELRKLGKSFSNTYIKFGVSTFLAQNNFFQANQTETATPSYTLLNAGIGTTLKMKKTREFLQLIFNVENLADVAYQNHLSRLKYAPENLATGRTGIFNTGRNFSIKAIFTF